MGYYTTNQITTTSLFVENVYDLTKNNIIIKIIVNKGLPLIFLQGISFCRDKYEVIIPNNSTLYIDYAMKKINYYKDKNNIICPDENKSIIVNMTNVIYCDYK